MEEDIGQGVLMVERADKPPKSCGTLYAASAVAALGSLCTPGLAHASTAQGDHALDLPVALNEIARRSGIELVFDPAQVSGTRVRLPTAGPPGAALTQLLAQTRFTFRQIDARAFVIVRRAVRPPEQPSLPEPSAGPEIMVVGEHSQNVDLVRGPDEIQPYTIVGGPDIAASGAPTLDDYLRTRLTLDRSPAPPSQATKSPRSQVDLHGLGDTQTLVLIDGRRLADVPRTGYVNGQSDLNAIPPEAVERIEVVATSAGGIFGIGATGGAINIVLKRDYRGAFLSADSGLTEKGDGIEHRVYGRIGWQSRDGRTKIMVSASFAHDGGLLGQDRPYQVQARALRSSYVGYIDSPVSNSLNIHSSTGAPLTFAPAYGGGSLGAASTYLPIGLGPFGPAAIAALAANAGRQDLSLASDGQAARSSLASASNRISVTASLRQDLGDSSQLFLDYLRLEGRGYTSQSRVFGQYQQVPRGVAGNPFAQAIDVSFPTGFAPTIGAERDIGQRATLGLLRRFAHGWSLEADAAYSTSTYASGQALSEPMGVPQLFNGGAALDASLAPLEDITIAQRQVAHLADGNLRLTGPVARLPGGPATLSLTGGYRRQWSPGSFDIETVTYLGSTSSFNTAQTPSERSVWSAFGEIRLPILPEGGASRPWRGLAAQVALRLDDYLLDVPGSLAPLAIHAHNSILAMTLGLQTRPTNGLMIRTSLSTAATPPNPSLLLGAVNQANLSFYSDPQRGGTSLGTKVNDTVGNPNLRPQSTITLSGGMVIEPDAWPGFRASIDYTALMTHHETVSRPIGLQYLLDHESTYPGAITRGPLTDADRTLGYTGGPVTAVYEGAVQTGHSTLQTLDATVSYSMPAGSGQLRLRADADWVIAFRRTANPLEGSFDLAGHSDGPIAWRSTLTAAWSNPRWSAGVQGQLYAGYSLGQALPAEQYEAYYSLATQLAASAQEPHVPVQDYFDMSVAFHPQGTRGWQIRLTIDNIFGKRPPIVANRVQGALAGVIDLTPPTGIADYGDILGRRFAINLSLPLGK